MDIPLAALGAAGGELGDVVQDLQATVILSEAKDLLNRLPDQAE